MFRLIFVLTQAAEDAITDHEDKGILQSHGPTENKTPKRDCKFLLSLFSQYAATYTECTTVFARPIRLCLRCHSRYLDILRVYKDFDNSTQDGVSCKVVLTKQDRLNVVDFTMESLTGPKSIWSTAMCNSK